MFVHLVELKVFKIRFKTLGFGGERGHNLFPASG